MLLLVGGVGPFPRCLGFMLVREFLNWVTAEEQLLPAGKALLPPPVLFDSLLERRYCDCGRERGPFMFWGNDASRIKASSARFSFKRYAPGFWFA